MEKDALKQEVDRLGPWWHSIDLGQGIITKGYDTVTNLKRLKMPEDLRGLSVLDIGACDGFYSFEAERRGAQKVLAADLTENWGTNAYGNGKKRFDFARKIMNSKVQDVEINVYDICPEKVGSFDLVLFLGVLYHLKHPLLGLEKVYDVTDKHLILQSHVNMLGCKRPVAVFYPGNECGNDSTNWWGPNELAVIAMLQTVGFKKIEVIARDYWKAKLFESRQGIVTIHAWK